MTRAIALVAPATARLAGLDRVEFARRLVVFGSAAALILAARPLPF
jgi:hypothetical protein